MPRSAPFLFVALLSLSVLVVGCAAAAQQAVQQATGVEVKQGGNQVTVKGTDGNSVTIDSTIPAELNDFPVPQGFKSEGGGSMTSGGDKMAAVSWKGTGQVQTVLDFYKTSLPGKGWKEESTFVSGDGAMLNYSKPDGYGLTVTVSADDKNNITVAVLGGKSSKTPTPAAQAQAQPTAKPQASSSKPEATPTPEPTTAPQAPATTDASAIPAELKDAPLPSGFAPVKNSATRVATGGKFQMAYVEYFGKTSVKDASAWYTSNLASKGWEVSLEQGGEDESVFICTSKADSTLTLSINVSADDAGTNIILSLTKTG